MRWFGVSDDGGEDCGVMMGKDMGGGKGSDRMGSCGLCWEGGWVLDSRPVGGYVGCLLSCGESVWGRVIFTSSSLGWCTMVLGSSSSSLPFPFWVRSASIFLLSLEFSYVSASISSTLRFLRSISFCYILACPSRILTNFKVLPTGMLGPALGSFTIPALLRVETILTSSRITW